ncbi:MAG: GNAT family N-acetyltransferase [Candidatus Heimdallarchaeota archaeon]|nr:GNAT family N-acetyltransferase [Candidatus Heimdallarchaeota archaeon]
MIRIKPLSSETIDGVVNVEIASTEKWYLYKSLDQRITKDYSELSPEQRWFHGGATMDIALFEKYLEELQRKKFDPLKFFVALEKKKVVGFAAIITGEDFLLGKHGYIDLLLVHPEHRRKGVAQKLVQHLETIAKEEDCENLFVYPEDFDGPSGRFYKKMGFEKWRDKYFVQIDAVDYCDYPFKWLSQPKTRKNYWLFEIGWNSSPGKSWILLHTTFAREFFEQKKEVKRMVDEQGNFAVVGVIRNHPFFTSGQASLWLTMEREDVENRVTSTHIKALKYLGFEAGLKKLNLYLLEDDLSFLQEKLKEWEIKNKPQKTEPWMIKRI